MKTVCPVDGQIGERDGEIPPGSPVKVVDGVDMLVACDTHSATEVNVALVDEGFQDALGQPFGQVPDEPLPGEG